MSFACQTRIVPLTMLLIAGCADDRGSTPRQDAGWMQGMDSGAVPLDAALDSGTRAVDGSLDGSALFACDPLADRPQPITLGQVIAAGKDATGTLYVISSSSYPDDPDLAFISTSAGLQRQRILGSGAGGSPDANFTVSLDEATPTRIVAKRVGDMIVGIALVHDQDKTFYDQLPASATQLTVVDPSTLSGMPVFNLPGQQELRAFGTGSDGSQLVVTFPRDDGTDADYRVYYGIGNVLTQRVVTMESQTLSSTLYLTFAVEGGTIDATIAGPSIFVPVGTSSQLTTAKGVVPLTVDLGQTTLPASDSFLCFE